MTDQTIQAVITTAQVAIKTNVTKIQAAPDYAIDARIAVPTSLVYATNIDMEQISEGFKLTWFDLVVNIIVPQGNMESAMHWLSDIPQSIGNVFRNDITIGGTCQTFEGSVMAEFIVDNSINGVGYKITVQRVKISG
jgi:hypothetical protein